MTLKRSELRRKSSALSRSPLRTRRKPRPQDPRAIEFKRVVWGWCAVCGSEGLVRRHHVTRQVDVAVEGGDEWDTRNSLWVGIESVCACHAAHHSRMRPIPFPLVPDAAVAFAVELLGSDLAAALYFSRFYAPEVN